MNQMQCCAFGLQSIYNSLDFPKYKHYYIPCFIMKHTELNKQKK